MKTAWSAALTAMATVGLVLLAAAQAPAPGPEPKPVEKWEYAELHYMASLDPARRGKGAGRPLPARVPVTWITADGEVEAASWDDMGKQLKARPAKKDAIEATQKLRVLNHLGAAGWEVYSHRTSELRPTTEVWLLKRKVK